MPIQRIKGKHALRRVVRNRDMEQADREVRTCADMRICV